MNTVKEILDAIIEDIVGFAPYILLFGGFLGFLIGDTNLIVMMILAAILLSNFYVP